MSDIDVGGTPPPDKQKPKGRHGRLAMLACCIPMLAIAVVIVLTGAGFRILFIALACTAMMGLMMAGMAHADRKDR